MNLSSRPGKTESLSLKQALTALSVAFVLGITLSSLQLFVEFRDAKQSFNRNIEQAIRAMKGPAAQAAYNFDNEAAAQIVEGLFEFKPIYKAKIEQNLGEVLAEKTRKDVTSEYPFLNPILGESITFDFKLTRTVKNTQKVVGKMLIIAEMNGVISDLVARFTRVLVSTMVQAFVLAIVLLYFFNAKITLPLLSIVEQLTDVTRKREHETLVAPPGHEHDEFGLLVQRTNALLNRIQTDSATLTQFAEDTRNINKDLELEINERKSAEFALRRAHDTLEERVMMRTDELTKEIAARRDTEKALEHAKHVADNANRAKSVFLANMSHEIRTPLNAILGFSQILLRKNSLPDGQADLIKIINSSGEHLLDLINDVLDLSKIEAGAMELQPVHFDLQETLDDLSSIFSIRCQEKGLTWSFDADSLSQTTVLGDQKKIRQVLINLLGNAVKFTDSGSVTLQVSQESTQQFYFNVIDTGAGIPLGVQEDIFKPFQQSTEGHSKGGTGLGLSISSRMLQLMDSELILKSDSNQGASFSFTLSLSVMEKQEKPSPAQATRVTRLASNASLCAIVADDIKGNRDLVENLLSSIGVNVEIATNGEEILHIMDKRTVDIVFTDVQMPVLDGVGAVRRIRDKWGADAPPCIAITAGAMMEQGAEESLNIDFDRVIYKPFHLDHIYEALMDLTHAEFEYEKNEHPIDTADT